MRTHRFLLFSLILILALPLAAQGRYQRARERVRDHRTQQWPPEKVYPRLTLGRALQGLFATHYEYCGFKKSSGNRDYIPTDVSKFLGKRDLRTRVEQADISGPSLLQYVFQAEETTRPLNSLRFESHNILASHKDAPAFTLNPEANFDAFVLTKNCSGYLKAALDAGVEPPYAAFRTALNTDEKRESTVVALSGVFLSPIYLQLQASDSRTTELMLALWRFYQAHPEYVGQAYYLRSFEGVMIKHLASATENRQLENEIGININGPFRSSVGINLGWGQSREGTFQGTNWETIVFTDFDEYYNRNDWFERLPSPTDISQYFAELAPRFQRSGDFPRLTEGVEHRHFVELEGIPEALAQGPWVLENIADGVYLAPPRVETQAYTNEDGTSGCRFTIIGQPAPTLFQGPLANRPGKVSLSYRIRHADPLAGRYLSFMVADELPTSAHPLAKLTDGRFDLSIKEDRRFSFQWQVAIEIEDVENPVDFTQQPYLTDIQVRRNGQSEPLQVQVINIVNDARRKQYILTFETLETWPLQRIDDTNMQSYTLDCKVHLPSLLSPSRMLRTLKGSISFPSLRPLPPPPVEIDLQVVPKNVDGGDGNG